MKKRFFIIGLLAIFALPAFAELTVDDTISKDYLKNHGYSDAIVRATHKSVAQISGEPTVEVAEKESYNRPVIKHLRKFFMYIDPALDNGSFWNNHNINTTTRYDDL